MSEPYFQTCSPSASAAQSYGKGTEIYKFEKIKRAKRAALAANPGAELIDMGVGEPDEMAFPEVRRDALRRGAQAREPRLCRQRRRGATRRPPPAG